jgi:hypothetical protein
VANASGHAVRTAPFAGIPPRPVRTRRRAAGEAGRYLGAVSILVVGAIHLQQYYDAYFRVVPTIGTLFLLSFIGAGIVGATLLAPARLLGGRMRDLAHVLAALGAIGIALGTLASLVYSEYEPLFGFMESGYRLAIVLTLLFDVLTTVFLGVFLLTANGTNVERDSSSGSAGNATGGYGG